MPQQTRADDDDRAIATLVRGITEAAGLSQFELAKRLGISPTTVGRYLRGESRITVPHFTAMIAAAGQDPGDAARAAAALVGIELPPAPERSTRATAAPRKPRRDAFERDKARLEPPPDRVRRPRKSNNPGQETG